MVVIVCATTPPGLLFYWEQSSSIWTAAGGPEAAVWDIESWRCQQTVTGSAPGTWVNIPVWHEVNRLWVRKGNTQLPCIETEHIYNICNICYIFHIGNLDLIFIKLKMARLNASTVTLLGLPVTLLTLSYLLLLVSVLVEQTKETSPQKTGLPEKPVEITVQVCVKRCYLALWCASLGSVFLSSVYVCLLTSCDTILLLNVYLILNIDMFAL